MTGIVPADWRKTNVVPIFKKGPRYIPGNYKPISLTSIVCKQELAVKNSIISSNQHGFMKDRTFQVNLLTFYEEVSSNLDKGRLVDVVYLDFTKAFPTVPHKCLIHKLRSVGINDSICTCMKSGYRGVPKGW